MNIKYKIIEVWPDEHQIVVRYTTDLITEESVVLARDADDNIVRCRTDVPITLPIPTPTGDALDSLIMQNAPVTFLKTKESVLDPNLDTSLSGLESLINVSKTQTYNEEYRLTSEDIAKVLSDFGKSS
jgi:tRNA A37 threonylcarbamoyltransferase TsaD